MNIIAGKANHFKTIENKYKQFSEAPDTSWENALSKRTEIVKYLQKLFYKKSNRNCFCQKDLQ